VKVTRRGLTIIVTLAGVMVALLGLVGLLLRPSTPRGWKLRPVRGASLLLLTMDTTRADHLGAFGGDDETTPNLDRLAASGVSFLQAQSPAPITLVAHASIHSGLYPYHHGVRNNGTFKLADSVPTLATVLGGEGYRTGAFVSAYVLARRYGLDHGFEIYDDDLSRGRQEHAGEVPSRRAEVTIDSAIQWLDSIDDGSSFFCWVHLYDPHAPYDPPGEYGRRFATDPYSGEISYMDAEIGRLLGHLEDRGMSDRLVIAAIGDHGEARGEHGELTHAILLHQATTRVPLILAGTTLPAGLKVQTPVSAVDLAPTMAWLLDTEFPSDLPLDGISLEPLLTGGSPGSTDRLIYSETMLPRFQYGWKTLRGLRRGKWQYVAGVRGSLFDLDRDPRELIDRLDRETLVRDELAGELDRIVAVDAATPHEQQPISESEREKLAALGYLGFSDLPRSDPPDPRDLIGAHVHMERSRTLSARGMTSEALVEIDRMLDEDSQNTSARSLKAGLLTQLGRFDEAAEELQAVIAFDPENAQSYRSLAQLEMARGRPQAALELARIGAEKRGAFGSLAASEAGALVALGRVAEAAALLDNKLAANPDDPELLAARAGIHLGSGAQGEGEALLRRAVAADALHHRSRLALASLLENTGRSEEAISLLEDLLRIDPGNAEALARIGAIHDDDPEAARAYLEEAVRLQPRRADYLLRLGVCYHKLGDSRRAEAALRRGLELRPEDHDLLNNLSIVLTLEERYAEAEAALDKVLEQDPDFAEARNNLALCLLYQERSDEAETEVRRALELEPELRDARLTLSSVLFETGRFAECRSVLEDLMAEGSDLELEGRLGMALEADGEPLLALPHLRAAVPSFPGHFELTMALARAEERVGDPVVAKRLYASLAQSSPPGELREKATEALERMALGRE
jgi:choline-sulfatase